MGIPFPEEYGGGGGDTLAYALAVEELTRIDSSVAITLCAHTSLGTQPIYLFGSEEQKREWLPELCAGEKLGAFGLTEPEAGSDAGNVEDPGDARDGGEWVINGAKQFITNAGTDISGVVAITAVTGDGTAAKEISNLIVAERHARLRAGRALPQDGLERVGHAAAHLHRLPRARGEPARPARRGVQAVPARPRHRAHRRRGDGRRARPGRARRGAGLRQGAQRAFGQPISKFQAIQAKLADMATEIEAGAPADLQGRAGEGPPANFTPHRRAGQAQDRPAGRARAEEAVQIHGGYGYIEEYPVCRFYRDAKILTIGEGTDEVQQMVIARALGGLSGLAARRGLRAGPGWLLFAVYAATLGVDASPGLALGPARAHYLLTAESIVSDGDVDLRDEYRARAWRAFGRGPLRPDGGRRPTAGSTSPTAPGFPLLIAPAYALGGATLVELFLAALAALGFVLAAALARRLVPEPWATGAARRRPLAARGGRGDDDRADGAGRPRSPARRCRAARARAPARAAGLRLAGPSRPAVARARKSLSLPAVMLVALPLAARPPPRARRAGGAGGRASPRWSSTCRSTIGSTAG